MKTIAVAFAVVFAAELGDKSQLMALAFATRFRAWRVLIAITVAAVATHGLSVLAGRVLADRLPTRPIAIAAGLAFLGFAWWTWRGEDQELNGEADAAAVGRRGAIAAMFAVGATFFLAEVGDKTMLATMALAARTEGSAVATWAGATLGMVGADALAIFVGRHLGARLPQRTIRVASTIGFVAFGVVLLADSA